MLVKRARCEIIVDYKKRYNEVTIMISQLCSNKVNKCANSDADITNNKYKQL